MKKVYIDLIDKDIKNIKKGQEVSYELYIYDGDKQKGEMIEVIARKEPNEHLNH
jgi:hypothetical protein